MIDKIRGTMMLMILNTSTENQNCTLTLFSSACLLTINKSQGLLTFWNVEVVWHQNCWYYFHLTPWNMMTHWTKTSYKLLLRLESSKWSSTSDFCSDNLFSPLDLLPNSNSAKIISCRYCTSAKMISLSHISFALLQEALFAASY